MTLETNKDHSACPSWYIKEFNDSYNTPFNAKTSLVNFILQRPLIWIPFPILPPQCAWCWFITSWHSASLWAGGTSKMACKSNFHCCFSTTKRQSTFQRLIWHQNFRFEDSQFFFKSLLISETMMLKILNLCFLRAY